jgi:segregation and condensation protein A
LYPKSTLPVRTEPFVGPLGLLLHLLQEKDLSINLISLTEVTDQYLKSILSMQDLDFEVASEFLVIAATLIYMKSKSLLPPEKALSEEEPVGPTLSPEALLLRLQEHKRYREAGHQLATLPKLDYEVFSRANSRPPIERFWSSMDITSLATCYQQVQVRSRRRTHVLRKETVSVSEKILEFRDRITPHQRIRFEALLRNPSSRTEKVATFMAILELSRLKKSRLFQEGTYEALFMELLESLEHFALDVVLKLDQELTGIGPVEPEKGMAS